MRDAKKVVEHLKMVQRPITRLGSNGFLIKGWSMTGSTIKSAVAFGLIVCTVGRGSVAGNPVEPPVAALDAVIVTATRVEAPLQQVPLSISALTGADLEQQDIGNLTELARWMPGFTVVDQGARGSNVIIARGLNTDSLNGSEFSGNNYNNGVATYLGDIPLAIDLRLHDIERIEVLLGPQGTLYGAGTLAGAVRYLPRRPNTGLAHVRGARQPVRPGARRRARFGCRCHVQFAAGFAQASAARLGRPLCTDPGFIDYNYLLRTPAMSEPEPDLSDPGAVEANLRSEPDANTEETVSARLSLLWEATPELSAIFTYHLQDQQIGARQINHAQSFDTGRYVAAHRYLEPNDRRNQLWSLELTWAPHWAELITAVGYSRFAAAGPARPDRPAYSGLRHRGTIARGVPSASAG